MTASRGAKLDEQRSRRQRRHHYKPAHVCLWALRLGVPILLIETLGSQPPGVLANTPLIRHGHAAVANAHYPTSFQQQPYSRHLLRQGAFESVDNTGKSLRQLLIGPLESQKLPEPTENLQMGNSQNHRRNDNDDGLEDTLDDATLYDDKVNKEEYFDPAEGLPSHNASSPMPPKTNNPNTPNQPNNATPGHNAGSQGNAAQGQGQPHVPGKPSTNATPYNGANNAPPDQQSFDQGEGKSETAPPQVLPPGAEGPPPAATVPAGSPEKKSATIDDAAAQMKEEELELEAEEAKEEELEEELKQEEREVRRIGGFGVFLAIVAMVFTAHQMSENPDGIYASFCRLIITLSSVGFKIFLMPFRSFLGGGRPYGHMPVSTMDYSYRDPYRPGATGSNMELS